jgi:hypothetical protein
MCGLIAFTFSLNIFGVFFSSPSKKKKIIGMLFFGWVKPNIFVPLVSEGAHITCM